MSGQTAEILHQISQQGETIEKEEPDDPTQYIILVENEEEFAPYINDSP